MPFDAFLYFKGAGGGSKLPEGETQDDTFSKEKAFEIKSFGFGAENAATIGSSTSGAGGGKCMFTKFTVKKNTDRSSPIFFQTLASGTHYESAYLSLRKGGGGDTSGRPYLTYKFSLVFVTKIQWSGSGGGNEDQPEEDLEFAYGSLKIEYYPQNADGTLAAAVPASWSQVLNKATDAVK